MALTEWRPEGDRIPRPPGARAEGGKVTDIRLLPPEQLKAVAEVPRADFTAHLNPEGTKVDFGKLATDGSVKVEKGDRALTVLPYPRDREFSVQLRIAQIVPGADVQTGKVRVRALAAGTQVDLGAVDARVNDGSVSFRTGVKGAGRYVVEW